MGTVVGFPDRSEVAKEAAAWLIRLDGDDPPTHEELVALGEWLNRSSVHREELESIAALWDRMNILTELAVPLGQASRAEGRSKDVGPLAVERPFWRKPTLLLASIAACAALVVTFVARVPRVDPLLETNGLYATAVGQQDTRALADGSQVILNTNSQIKVEYGDSFRRVYLLQGEALFTVAKNAERPFRVYAGNGVIEAVGTAFSVYLKGAEVDVAVEEGRVALAAIRSSEDASRQEVTRSLGLLSAGQVATLRTAANDPDAGGAVVLDEVELITPQQFAQRLAWRDGVLMFSGETLEDVVKELSRYTTVSIEIPDEAIRSMRVGGRFPIGETESMLAALETNFNLRVIRLTHNRVVLAPADE